ncbi:MAG: hypothetical protein JNM40_01595 [Myxococcales bacterium]|nr:hypothetical protein [Myxococcales bacterium]
MPNPQRIKLPLRSSNPALMMMASRRPTTASAALDTLLQRARQLCNEGIEPRLPIDRCLMALGPVLTFVANEPALHAEVALSREMCGAVLRIAEELQGKTPLAAKLRAPLTIVAPQSPRHGETLRTSALLLEAYRDSVRRVLKGPSNAGLRAEFGLGNSLSLSDGKQIADGIARFLLAAQRFPDCIGSAGLQPAQLIGLAAQERVLRALEADAERQSTAQDSRYRQRVLHLALEYFLERFQAALHLHLSQKQSRLTEGLSLLPSQTQRPLSRPRSGLASCQVTESGRLIFS